MLRSIVFVHPIILLTVYLVCNSMFVRLVMQDGFVQFVFGLLLAASLYIWPLAVHQFCKSIGIFEYDKKDLLYTVAFGMSVVICPIFFEIAGERENPHYGIMVFSMSVVIIPSAFLSFMFIWRLSTRIVALREQATGKSVDVLLIFFSLCTFPFFSWFIQRQLKAYLTFAEKEDNDN